MSGIKLSGITNEQKIQDAIKLLYANLSKYPHEEFEIICGGPAGKQPIEICYSKANEFWWGTKVEEKKHQYWNPVGFDYPNPDLINSSDCEFNCALKDFKGNAGFFGKDTRSNIYLLHSGKAGGNTTGTTIEAFCEFYKGSDRHQVLIDGETINFFIVSDINSNDLLDNIIKYAKAIFDFKVDLKSKISDKK